MSILKGLKLATAEPLRTSADPVERARSKTVSWLADQRKLAEAKIAGQHYAPTHMVWRKNAEGQRVQIEAPRRVVSGLFADASGQFFFSVRYAGRQLEIANGKNAVAVGEITNLPGIIDTLTEAVRAGELDAQLASAAAERGHMLRKAG